MQLDNETLLKLLAVMISGGVGVSLVAQFLKKQLGLKTNAVIHTVVLVLASLAAFAQYFQQIHSQLAPSILGISTATIYGISQLVFKYASYGSAFVSKVNAYNQGQSPATSTDTQTTYSTQVFSAPTSVSSTTSSFITPDKPQGFEL
jgi:hypothetical protein